MYGEGQISEDVINIFFPQVTGTGHGIGKELALQYSNLGATLVCLDINEKGNLETVKEIKSRGGKAYAFV